MIFELQFQRHYDVITVASVQSAHDALKEQSFDVIASDLILFNENGLDFLTEIRKDHPNTPFFLISGYIDTDENTDWKKGGVVDHFVEKPYDFEELLDLVNGAVETATEKREN